MMSRFSFLFLLLITSLVSAEKYALLVGINDYQGDISPLRYCVTDVQAFRDALVDVADYKPENVHLMTDQMEGRDLPEFNNVLLRLETLARQVPFCANVVPQTSSHLFCFHGGAVHCLALVLAVPSGVRAVGIKHESKIFWSPC